MNMVDVFNLKEGDKIRYDIPDNFDENFKHLNGEIAEIVEIVHVFHPETFDAVIKPMVKNIKNGQVCALSPKLYGYITLV